MYRRYYNKYDNYPSEDGNSINEEKIERDNLNTTYQKNNPYRINSYEEPKIIVPEKSSTEEPNDHSENLHTIQNLEIDQHHSKIKRIIGNFDIDDILLLALIVLLIFEECDDYFLIAVLAFIFISGWEN